MVVMDCIPDAHSLHHFFLSPSAPLPDPPSAKVVRQDLTKALDLLHGRDFVFGDLRPPNVLYSPRRDCAFLIGFDGVGKHMKDRYPTSLNTELKRDLGVRGWQIMEKSHDRANMERVVDWLPYSCNLPFDS
jgi:serine/threonine protein kinase